MLCSTPEEKVAWQEPWIESQVSPGKKKKSCPARTLAYCCWKSSCSQKKKKLPCNSPGLPWLESQLFLDRSLGLQESWIETNLSPEKNNKKTVFLQEPWLESQLAPEKQKLPCKNPALKVMSLQQKKHCPARTLAYPGWKTSFPQKKQLPCKNPGLKVISPQTGA